MFQKANPSRFRKLCWDPRRNTLDRIVLNRLLFAEKAPDTDCDTSLGSLDFDDDFDISLGSGLDFDVDSDTSLGSLDFDVDFDTSLLFYAVLKT